MIYATHDQIATLLNVRPDKLDILVKKNGLPRESGKGKKYDINRVIRWLIKYHDEQLNNLSSKRLNWSVEEIADLLRKEVRWINRLVKEKGLPRISRGIYNIKDVIRWLITDYDKRIETAKHGDQSMYEAEKREQIAKAGIAEIKLARTRAEVINITDATNLLKDGITTVRSQLLAEPRKLAPRLILKSSPNEIEQILETEIYAILDELSNLPDTLSRIAQIYPVDEGSLDDVHAAEKIDSKSMGGRTQDPKRRKRKRNRKMA